MYTATQARNLAQEVNHHKYYKFYKEYVDIIMKDISKRISVGVFVYATSFRNITSVEVKVLKQVLRELENYGYRTKMRTETTNDKKNIYHIMIDWRPQPKKEVIDAKSSF